MKMPASGSEHFHRFLRSHSDLTGNHIARVSNGGSVTCSPHYSPQSPLSPSSPVLSSPKTSAPITTLRRNFSSTFSLIPEEELPVIEEESTSDKNENFLYKIITWYPFFVLNLIQSVVGTVVNLTWSQTLVVIPTLWVSAYLWLFWKAIQCPLSLVKWVLTMLNTSASERNRRKRTVLISGGSTVQTLHLARNFYSSGSRVIVFEVEDLFALAKFSTAVDKFYTIPKPRVESPQQYIKALCEIVETEKVNYYVPVSATTSAYFDAIAKPHLEVLGCSCFNPNLKEVSILDDVAEILQRCQSMGKPTPLFTTVTSKEDIEKWYNNTDIPHDRTYFMASCGLLGIRNRFKFMMPKSMKNFRLGVEVSEDKPWVIVQDMRGDHYMTCTTVKDSQVIANVTCKIESKSKSIMHEENKEINAWLKQFFNKLGVQRPITGHISFRFVKDSNTGIILPLGCKVGVSLPYICHTSVHPRLLWKPCPHFNRSRSGPIVAPDGRYWMPDTVVNTLRHPGLEAVGKLIGNVLDKREALFAYWDPLPYCAYYHIQLPLSTINSYILKKGSCDFRVTSTGKSTAVVE